MEYTLQDVQFSHLANSQDASASSCDPSTSATVEASDGLAYPQPRPHAGSYTQPAVSSDAPDILRDTTLVDGPTDAGEGTLHTGTSASSHLDDIVMQVVPSIERLQSQTPVPSTRTLRLQKGASASSSQASAPKRAVVHEARTNPGAQIGSRHENAPADTPPCNYDNADDASSDGDDNDDGDDDGGEHMDLRNRSNPRQAIQVLEGLMNAMETRSGGSRKNRLTQKFKTGINRQKVPDMGDSLAVAETDGTIEHAMIAKTFECRTCGKVETSASKLR